VIEALALLVLLLLSAFFSGSEIALFSVPQARARALADEGRRGSGALAELRSQPDRLLITILIGNNVVNIAAASIATFEATRAFGSAGVGLATGAVTLLVLFFGEITPKSFASSHAVTFSLFAAPIVLGLSRALFFLVIPLEHLTRLFVPRGAGRSAPGVTEMEIRRLTQMGHLAGAIEEHERQLIERAFLMDTTRAWEVMTPRVDIFAWPQDRTVDDLAPELGSVPYSRIPVYDESLDDITGVLYLRDAFEALVEGRGATTLADLAREPFVVPGSVTLVELLREFQARRVHVGVVVDEYGGTDGLVTLEDILEELVGEIVDEVDVPEETIIRISREEALVDGSADLRDINDVFGTDLPVAEHRSLNGYLLEELGRVPRPHETVERQGLRMEVLGSTDTQVTRVRLVRAGTRRSERGGRSTVDARARD
jgi:CBS domain containing-hemolysin-like protein